MAKPKGVIRLRHRKEPHLEVLLYQDQETKKVTAICVDWERGKVLQLKEEESQSDQHVSNMRKTNKEA